MLLIFFNSTSTPSHHPMLGSSEAAGEVKAGSSRLLLFLAGYKRWGMDDAERRAATAAAARCRKGKGE